MSADPMAALHEETGQLAVSLAEWSYREEAADKAAARHAARVAVDTIDAMLRELHELRAQLVGEARAYDDATAARVDELLRGRAAAAPAPRVDGSLPDGES